ncbi:hypothetical protein D5041_20505 [Verminephrobacter aporrectodeae subsp. tuberculatae]|uniref:hypothetical protein n=1 Tax=Verminephrobacter aporrectodeae TaxID=1110389 RepID=UPI002236FF9E|nr:hypothetical protein [Verminephrobacter aporrectodeae]MCW5222028.1 hypothetical protein [Verminephrobacter aporrectodeae subsp. tuberculatae]MCW5291319.1 hypothetical protein [Verminephrobacter aporrectodeae subsp. tuberculatae]
MHQLPDLSQVDRARKDGLGHEQSAVGQTSSHMLERKHTIFNKNFCIIVPEYEKGENVFVNRDVRFAVEQDK